VRARRWWAWPLVPVYAAGLAVKDGLRALGILRARRLQWPVVSVGSLSAGGAGKTPVVIALAELLKGRGWSVDVLSRGYGRKGEGVAKVDPLGSTAAERFGDEPVMIARYARVGVWVGAKRFLAGDAAELASDTQMRCVHLLDDGFQHRQLARRVDIVLVTAVDFDDVLLPAGNLRERLAALRRADVVVLREEEQEHVGPRLLGLIRAETSIWIIRRRLYRGVPKREPNARPKVVAFCAIARPEGFWSMLQAAEFDVVKTVAFEDHHAYTMDDMERLVEIARENEATGFVMTTKDHVKISHPMMRRLLSIGPVAIGRLELKFVDEAGVMRELEGRIG
jgi:tetraacyldisaccharide 4'-kinase